MLGQNSAILSKVVSKIVMFKNVFAMYLLSIGSSDM